MSQNSLIFLLFSSFLSVLCDERPLLLVISFDGFSPKYLERGLTPHLKKLQEAGTRAPFLRNVFPTKTFPNHHSIATGLYPAEHGVLAAEVYDLELGKLTYGPDLYGYNRFVAPIWAWNEMSNGKSGCMMWPGSDFSYGLKDVNCSYTEKMNVTHPGPWEERLEKSVEWFNSGANLVMLYIEEPDHNGHIYGVDDAQNEILRKLDNFTSLLEEKLKSAKLWEKMNVIILSDHGMIDTKPANFINITKYLPSHKEEIYGNSPVLQISPTTASIDDIYNRLMNASKLENDTFKVYRNSDLPERWNYRNERRSGPITVVAEPGFAFKHDMTPAVEYYQKTYNLTVTNETTFGIHGYDNSFREMNSLFLAWGPAIKKSHVVAPFDTVDLFHLFCEILKIKPPEISGNRDNILDVLNNGNQNAAISGFLIAIAGICVSFCLVAAAFAVLVVVRRRREAQMVPEFIYDEPEHMEEQKLLEIGIGSEKFDSEA
ncbi:bis(5'-adenosyl)-triphosphatase ENPP4-like [Culicoides brevitarsis]|uniref:bis(5'-adenosyl)-triphosphatase ENPP4-like n=1 Tax=Culicoides brevitarsis TaxID=469753 RepID=UPI00307C0F5F